jgi:hypothetical protein
MRRNTHGGRARALVLVLLGVVLAGALAVPTASALPSAAGPPARANDNTPVITASATGPGTISPSGAVSVPYGRNQAFTMTPATRSHVLDVTVDGKSVGAVTTYTFREVVANHTIAATFAPDVVVISASAGPNGSISPSGDVSVSYGGSQTFVVQPNAGYHVADVLVDGASVGAVTKYTFTNVTAAHAIKASFAPDAFVIHAGAGPHGSISPSGDVPVRLGASQTFTIVPDGGYQVADVLVDGQSVGPVTAYTFEKVTAAHTIAASFAAQPAVRLSPFLAPGLIIGKGFEPQVLFTVRTAPAAAVAGLGPASLRAARAAPPGQFSVTVLKPGATTPSAIVITWSTLPDGTSAAKGTLPSQAMGDYEVTVLYKSVAGSEVVQTVDYKVSGYYAPLDGLPVTKSINLSGTWPAKKSFPLRLRVRNSKGGPVLKATPRLYVFDLATGVRVFRAKGLFKSLGGGKYGFAWLPRLMKPFPAWRGTWRQLQIVVPHYVKGVKQGEKTLGSIKVKWW